MPDSVTVDPAPPALRASQREILVYLAALERAGRPAPSLRILAQETCVTIATFEVRKECSALRAAGLIDWAHIFEPGTRRDNAVVLTEQGRPIALELLRDAGDEAPRFDPIVERTCLTCREPFLSDGRHNRLCARCNALDIV